MAGTTKKKISTTKTKTKTPTTKARTRSSASSSSSSKGSTMSLQTMRAHAKNHPEGPFRVVLARPKTNQTIA